MADGKNSVATSDKKPPLPVVRLYGIPDEELSTTESESETLPVRSTNKMARSWEGRSKTYVTDSTSATCMDINKSGESSHMIDRQREGPHTAMFALEPTRMDYPSKITNEELATPDDEIQSVTSATDTRFPRLQADKRHRSGKVWKRSYDNVCGLPKVPYIENANFHHIESCLCECGLYASTRMT